MNEISIFKPKRKTQIVVLYIVLIAICTTLFMLFGSVETGLMYLAMNSIIFVFVLINNKDPRKGCYFRFDNSKVEWLFPFMEAGKELNVENIHSVQEQWYGLSFINSEGQTIEFSTDGLNKKKKRQIVNVFMEMSVATQFIAS